MIDDIEIPEQQIDVAAMQEQPSYTQQEAEFIASLSDSHSDETHDVVASEDVALSQAANTSLFVLNQVENMLKRVGHKDFSWQKEEKEQTAHAVAPALIKSGGKLPDWLEPYKEEAFALFAVGTLAYGGYLQIKELKELDILRDKKQKELSEDAA